MASEKKFEDWLTDGFIIAACPVIAYLYAFTYEAGFASFFNIPLEFIKITVNNIILFFGGLSIICLLIYLPLEVISMWIPQESPIFRRLVRYIPLFCFFISTAYLYGFKNYYTYIGWLPIFLFLVFRDFVAPLITQKDKKTYFEKLSAFEFQDKEDFNKNPPRILYSIFNWFKNKNSINLVLLLFFLIGYSYQKGVADASKQEKFLVCRNLSPVIVLRIYGDNLVCVPYDEKTKSVKSVFSIFKITSDNQNSLSYEKVGPFEKNKDDVFQKK